MNAASCGMHHDFALACHEASGRPAEEASEGRPTPLEALRDGDLQAWERLLTRMEKRCLTLAWRILNDSHLAADAVQDGFFKAYRGREDLGAQSRAEHWLLAAVANAARDAARKRACDQTARTRLLEQAQSAQNRSFHQDGLEEDLRDALSRLEQPERTIFLLVHQEGFTYQQVADEFGWPVGTVRSKLHRTRQALRILLQREQKP